VRGVQAIGLAALGALGCSSGSGSNACADVPGSYELSVTATGQSENGQSLCATGTTPSVVDVAITGDDAVVNVAAAQAESCRVTSTAGCQIEIACGGDAGADAAASPTFVQNATFALPSSGSGPTSNALVELGAGYCGFEGTASRQ
jgi:hypothetical protein